MKQFLFFLLLGGGLAIGCILFLNQSSGQLITVENGIQKQFEKNKERVPEPRKPITLFFGGDMQLDRYIRSVVLKRGWRYLLSDTLRQELERADVVIANLEGPITDAPSVSLMSKEGARENYIFTFPPEGATFLRDAHINLVNIGNNHILNFKEAGVKETKQYLSQAGVQFFGSPLTGDDRVLIQIFGDTKVAFVNYNEFIFQGKEKALADIASVRDKADFVILYTHWGKEYVEVQDRVKNLAYEFIDAGADLIIGSHPHVVQAKEEYRGKMIYYSLGNFIFDQYFSRETSEGLLVRAILDPAKGSITTEDIALKLFPSGQTTLRSEY